MCLKCSNDLTNIIITEWSKRETLTNTPPAAPIRQNSISLLLFSTALGSASPVAWVTKAKIPLLWLAGFLASGNHSQAFC